jgi:hypothetical protein
MRENGLRGADGAALGGIGGAGDPPDGRRGAEPRGTARRRARGGGHAVRRARAGAEGAAGVAGARSTPAAAAHQPRAALLFYTVVGCHSLGIYAVILWSLLSLSVRMTVSPWAAAHTLPSKSSTSETPRGGGVAAGPNRTGPVARRSRRRSPRAAPMPCPTRGGRRPRRPSTEGACHGVGPRLLAWLAPHGVLAG